MKQDTPLQQFAGGVAQGFTETFSYGELLLGMLGGLAALFIWQSVVKRKLHWIEVGIGCFVGYVFGHLAYKFW